MAFEFRKKRITSPQCKVYVNGQPFVAQWNNFNNPKDAFDFVMKNDYGFSILRDSVTIVESINTIYEVDYFS